MLDFFCQFADKLHHGKEEDYLFTVMESKGFPRDGGPTGVMLDEHEQGRIHIRGMVQALDSADTGNTTSIEAFTQHALAYVDLLRQHIQKEDHCLFPMANQALSDSEQQQLADSFAAADSDPAKAGLRDRFARLAAELDE
jgi:hemerythrin-like domain-containing protein